MGLNFITSLIYQYLNHTDMVYTAATLVCTLNLFIVFKGSDDVITLPQECKIGVSSFETPNECFVAQATFLTRHAPGHRL